MQSTSFSDGMEIRYANVERHPLCSCIYLDESHHEPRYPGDSRHPSHESLHHAAGSRIQDELRQVQQELINLQGMIQNDLFEGSEDESLRGPDASRAVRYANPLCSVHPSPHMQMHSSPRGTRRRHRSEPVESLDVSHSELQREREEIEVS